MPRAVSRFATALLAVSLAAPPSIARAAELMAADQLKSEFGGHSITGYYTADAVAFVETYKDDGGITYEDTRDADSGKWSIEGNRFCTFYEHMSGACWYVVKQAPDCYEFYDAKDFGTDPATLDGTLHHVVHARAARDAGKLTCKPWVGT